MTVFLGTSEFAAAVLVRLAQSEHPPKLVLSRPDRPRGRGRKTGAPPVAELARELGIELAQPADPNDALPRIQELAPAALCLCAYGAIIREPLLSAFPMLNIHPSLLPRWRGAAPIERAIMAGDAQSGVSIMAVTAGLDSGPVCLQEAEPILPADNYGTLAARLEQLGSDLLIEALGGPREWRQQDEAGVTYAEKISAEDRVLDAARPAQELARLVRALHPHVGARTPDGLRVLEAQLASGDALLSFGGLELLCVQPPGGRPMDAAAYLRGHAG